VPKTASIVNRKIRDISHLSMLQADAIRGIALDLELQAVGCVVPQGRNRTTDTRIFGQAGNWFM
jgi:hypothetical protein